MKRVLPNYPHIEKNSVYGYLFISDRDWNLYELYKDGASPVTLLDMPESEKMSGGNLYRVLNRVEWIMRHRSAGGLIFRYDTEKRHGRIIEIKARKYNIPKSFYQEAAMPHYVKNQLERFKP